MTGPVRKPVGIADSERLQADGLLNGRMLVVCDDGSLWEYYGDIGEEPWRQKEPIPGTLAAQDAEKWAGKTPCTVCGDPVSDGVLYCSDRCQGNAEADECADADCSYPVAPGETQCGAHGGLDHQDAQRSPLRATQARRGPRVGARAGNAAWRRILRPERLRVRGQQEGEHHG